MPQIYFKIIILIISINVKMESLNTIAHFSTGITKTICKFYCKYKSKREKSEINIFTIPPSFPQKIKRKEQRKLHVHFEKCVSQY